MVLMDPRLNGQHVTHLTKALLCTALFVVLFLFVCEKRPLHWVGGYRRALLRHWGFH